LISERWATRFFASVGLPRPASRALPAVASPAAMTLRATLDPARSSPFQKRASGPGEKWGPRSAIPLRRLRPQPAERGALASRQHATSAQRPTASGGGGPAEGADTDGGPDLPTLHVGCVRNPRSGSASAPRQHATSAQRPTASGAWTSGGHGYGRVAQICQPHTSTASPTGRAETRPRLASTPPRLSGQPPVGRGPPEGTDTDGWPKSANPARRLDPQLAERGASAPRQHPTSAQRPTAGGAADLRRGQDRQRPKGVSPHKSVKVRKSITVAVVRRRRASTFPRRTRAATASPGGFPGGRAPPDREQAPTRRTQGARRRESPEAGRQTNH
jgi:hypothetical protein